MSFKFIQRCLLATLLCGSVTAPAVAQEAAFQAIEQAAFQVDETAPLQPARQAFEDPVGPSPAAREFANTVLASRTQPSTLLSPQRRRHIRSNSDVVFGSEAKFRVSTDTGNLLGESPYAAGVQAQSRSPVITSTSIHGSTVGQLLASGSYWFPARQDLDTVLSKIDSRIIQDVIITKGPFATRYGPGFDFVDFQLLQSPRYEDGYESHGSTSYEYKTNGEQMYGRQALWGGSDNYGYRISYGNRTGNDYQDANGTNYLSSYKQQDIDVALGYDFSRTSHLELNYIWHEQNDVEVPTQLLDIDHLATHGFEATLVHEDCDVFDVVTFETWYNQTRLTGNANSAAKRERIPFLARNVVSIRSDAENMSTGFSLFGDVETEDVVTTVGVDLRYLTQEVNQFSVVPAVAVPNLYGNNDTPEVNGPVPDAYSANPGLFMEQSIDLTERLRVNTGARVDLVEMNASRTADEVGGLTGPLSFVGPNGEFPFAYNPNGDPVTIPDGMGGTVVVPGVEAGIDDLLLGSFNQSYGLSSAFIDADYELDPNWTANLGFGFGMRAPTMTELYSLQHISTIFPQQTFSILFGNPNLEPERRYQINGGLEVQQEWYRARLNVFHAWIENYITYDALHPNFYVFQTVNTDLATLAGMDYYGEVDMTRQWSIFLNATYTEGRDRTRTSNPAPSLFDPIGSEQRSLLAGVEKEALPNIPPLEARLGFRFDDGHVQSRWHTEISARFVDGQDKIATSLGEMTTPGYTVWDIRGFWQATDMLSINVGVENFGNRQYQDHLDPHGRMLPSNPFAPGTEESLGSVFRPGASFYFATELVY